MSTTLFDADVAPARTTTISDRSPLPTWGCALAIAALGTSTLWKSSVGINWGLCIASVAAAIILGARQRFGAAGAPAIVACAWAVVIALCTSITTDQARITALILASLVLLAIALISAGQRSLDVLHLRTAVFAPIAALALTIVGFIAELTGGSRITRSARASAIIRTALITIPIVIALILLLGDADPFFAVIRRALEHVFPDDVFEQLLFFSFLLVVTLGALGSVQTGATHVQAASPSARATIGILERRVLLASVATIMWTFVVSAYISLTRDPAAKAGSGITYAEYVHNGFAQLSIAASIVIGVVLLTRRSWLASDGVARALAQAALAGMFGMVAIAFMRVVGYERVYGFTTLRIYAQAYMVMLACMSALLSIEISHRAPSARFAFHSAIAALGIMTSCILWNTDAWIVHRNVERYISTGKLDTSYITSELSDDAIPALAERVHLLREPERSLVIGSLRRKDIENHWQPRDWYEWNLRASASTKAARAFHGNDIAGALQMPDE